jgi:hypothetical protein
MGSEWAPGNTFVDIQVTPCGHAVFPIVNLSTTVTAPAAVTS